MNLQDPLVQFTLDATRQAARLAAMVQDEMVTPAILKNDRSPVTIADYAVQAYISARIEAQYPSMGLIAEEDAQGLRQQDQQETLQHVTRYVRRLLPQADPERVCRWIDKGTQPVGRQAWVLDPIDGTKGFLRHDQYAVALALLEDGTVRAGALGCPRLRLQSRADLDERGILAIAARGEGCWASSVRGEAPFTALQVSSCEDVSLARILRSYEDSHTNAGMIDALAARLGTNAAPVRLDSQAKYALLAAGEGELYLRMLTPERKDYREKVWDQAAGSIVIEEAGGKVSDLDGKTLDFTLGRTLAHNRGILASNGRCHSETLRALKEIEAHI